ncbi:MAG: pyridoxamine 5'-phosphate oxidase family protein [Bacilli bacterium]|jgi:hypothetical protein|nr:pyridoxamine 5'-phosphate oxidase family protein [Bacilli bacterium]
MMRETKNMVLSDTLKEVLTKEGVVAIVSWYKKEPHITNTWNTYITVVDENTFLIPAGVMKTLEKNVQKNKNVKISIGSREVVGFNKYQGTGFLLEGEASFSYDEAYVKMLKKKYPWLTRVLVIEITTYKQLL